MSRSTGELELPDRRMFWRWLAEAIRPVLGWVLVALGVLALVLGWYGVSGQSLTAKQLPYLVSGGLTGIGLIVVAAVFLAGDDLHRQLNRLDTLERKVEDLYSLFVDDLGAPPAVAVSDASAATGVALPTGSSYHRPDCSLVSGKAAATTVDGAAIRSRSLTPCRICEPDRVRS